MALKPVYQSESEIPEGLKEHYSSQSDGRWKVNLEGGVKSQADIDRLETTIGTLRETEREYTKFKSKIPSDFDAEKWDKVKNLDPNGNGSDKTEDEIRVSVGEEYRKKIEEAEKERDSAKDYAKRTIKMIHLKQDLAELGFTDPYRLDDFINRLERDKDPVLKNIDAIEKNDIFEMIGGAVGDTQGYKESLKKISETDLAKRYKPHDNSGGGAGNDGSGDVEVKDNPFDRENGNRTQRGVIAKENPDKATNLAKKAGWKESEMYWKK